MSKNDKVEIVTNSDYWLEGLDDIYDVSDDNQFGLDINLIRLATAKRAISNFVNILTNKNIPVIFNDSGDSFTDGKIVCLSANIVEKKDFDPAVGLALHEGSHILLSDFNSIKTLWSHIPSELYKLAKIKKIRKNTVSELAKYMLNYVEDRYIDQFVYNEAPGYRGYYLSLYEKYYNNGVISDMLTSKMYREESLVAYKYRVINLTNSHTDLTALKGLHKIAEVIDLKNINRLTKQQDRIDIAFGVVKIILENVDDIDDKKDDNKQSDSSTENSDDNTAVGTPFEEKESPKNTTNIGDTSDLSDNKLKRIERAISKQDDFLNGSVKKKKVDKKTKTLLDTIEKSGIAITKVGKDLCNNNINYKGIECIVVKNLTRELIDTDQFPLKAKSKSSFDKNYYSKPCADAVRKGIRMGVLLGKKLQIRNESNVTTFTRKMVGKIDNHLLADVGWNSEKIFSVKQMDSYNDTFLHISVDASSSMISPFTKWTETLTTVIAICKAATMLNNVHVTVSFRSTVYSTNRRDCSMPYVVLAYDSSKDHFSKVINLFPLLLPAGMTPEGLSYEAIIDYFNQKNLNENRYFLNFSDGEPYMSYNNDLMTISYSGEIAFNHTRKQVNNIKNAGYEVLSYFIGRDINDYHYNTELAKGFKRMYGSSAEFIKIGNITEIIKTLNKLFINKN